MPTDFMNVAEVLQQGRPDFARTESHSYADFASSDNFLYIMQLSLLFVTSCLSINELKITNSVRITKKCNN